MERNRWQQIEELYHAALERAPDDRAAFLAEACAGDSGLRRESKSCCAMTALRRASSNRTRWVLESFDASPNKDE